MPRPVLGLTLGTVLMGSLVCHLGAQDDLDAVLARATAYVEAFQRDLSMVVAEEHYEQEARYPGPPFSRSQDLTKRTTLVSDFLLVRTDTGTWVPFRDVFERDGKAVRDREERLSALFLADRGSAFEQARRIVDESARYNVGSINRNINLPTLALVFLSGTYRARFDFSDRGSEDRGATRLVQYREEQRPTYISTTAGRDLPASGRFWIEARTGRVLRTELHASDSAIDAQINVTYQPDDAVGLMVPVLMEEQYRQKSDRSEVRGVARYTRFRRFQVQTSEDLAK